MSIRTATPEDLDTVTDLLIGFRDWWNSTSPSDETFRTTAAKLLEDPNTEFLLAGTDGLAQIRFRLSAWTGVEDCWLEDVYVRDEARGTGLGKALTQAAIDRPGNEAASGSSSTSTSRTRTRSVSTRASASRSSPNRRAAPCFSERSSSTSSCLRHHW